MAVAVADLNLREHAVTRAVLLVMHVIFRHISISRCGCLSMELEALRCLCSTYV
jgi:hypothetical protein